MVLPGLYHRFLEPAHFHGVAYDIKAYGALSVVVLYFVAERFLPDFSSNQVFSTICSFVKNLPFGIGGQDVEYKPEKRACGFDSWG